MLYHTIQEKRCDISSIIFMPILVFLDSFRLQLLPCKQMDFFNPTEEFEVVLKLINDMLKENANNEDITIAIIKYQNIAKLSVFTEADFIKSLQQRISCTISLN